MAAAVADLPRLRSAPSTPERDRKRLLRTMLGDVTRAPVRARANFGSGCVGTLRHDRGTPRPADETGHRLAAHTPEAVALAREVGPRMTHPQLAAALNAAGHATRAGRPFDTTAASNLRHAYGIGSPELRTDGELTTRAVADRLAVSMSTVSNGCAGGGPISRANFRKRVWLPAVKREVSASRFGSTTCAIRTRHGSSQAEPT